MADRMIDGIGVAQDISPDDTMFQGDLDHYFRVGQSALECIRSSLDAARVRPGEVKRILDLPCGHGRVLRHLRAAFPQAAIVACDLLRAGVDYCARTFGASPVYSDEDPARVPLADSAFDLVWVGSLLTHVDSARWAGFLALFRRTLRPQGVLVFTTHGRAAYDLTVGRAITYGLSPGRMTAVLRSYERTGFGYAHHPGASSYGHSLSSPSWVFEQIAAIGEMRMVHASERAWDNHQDVFACVRDPGWQALHPRTSVWTVLEQKLRERIGRGRASLTASTQESAQRSRPGTPPSAHG